MKSSTLVGLGILASLIVGGSGLMYQSYSRGQDIQNSRIESNEDAYIGIQGDVRSIQTDIENIKEDIRDSKKVQEKILDKLDALR
jgi:hypothetical protein